MLQPVFDSLYVLVCFLLLVVVLLQQGKGGDIAAAFGGGSSQTAFGARSGATVLTRATAVLGTMFMLGALALAIVGQRGNTGSVVGDVPAPAPAQTAPAPVTTTPPAVPKGVPPTQKPSTPEQKPSGETQPKKPGGQM